MKTNNMTGVITQRWENIKDKFTMIRENRKLITQFLFALLFIGLGAWFIKHEQTELGKVQQVLISSEWTVIVLGIASTIIYIFLLGLMYKLSFATVKNRISMRVAVLLFLKRNFISVFMPAGGVTSLAFFTGEIEKEGISITRIHFASSVYAFVGMLSVVLVAIPVFLYTLLKGLTTSGEWIATGLVLLMVAALLAVYRSVIHNGIIFRWIVKVFPKSQVFLEDLLSHSLDIRYLVITVIVSVLIDLTCVVQVYIAMKALGFHASVLFAMLGYLTGVLSTIISPFMRGIGAVEVSLSFVLVRFGYSNVEAVAITFLYRFFEFWLPLMTGAFAFLMKINKLLMRVLPAILIFALGIVNIISVLTPAIHERVLRLQEFIPLEAISASNYFVLIAGIFMLLTAVFMLKGMRSAWWIALALSLGSVVGHLTKAIDYEEAIVASLVIVMLLFSRKEYYVKGNPKLHSIGIQTALLSVIAVLIYGIIGFYFLDKKHFGIDFNTTQSIRYTVLNFFMVGSADLVPKSRFAHDFLLSINVSGFLSLSFLFYTIIRPHIFKAEADPGILTRAKSLVKEFGNSGMDYFKTYHDKLLYFPDDLNAFVSYRIAGSYAVVLENPVADTPTGMKKCIAKFDRYSYEHGFKTIYYRVPEESLTVYLEMNKKSLFLGQEGVVKLSTFSLEGGKNKPLRNAINKVTDRGYKSSVHVPPIKDGLMQKLKAVSDDWLKTTQRHEIIFSQGMFVWEELKYQTIITVENEEEKVVAFLNIIPDYSPGEGTYDLIRKTEDAPNGIMDFLLIELIKYLKSQGFSTLNLGFAPMSGMNDPTTFTQKTMKFAYEKIKSFAHYKGLRLFKEKFFPVWQNRYLIYSNDYDLLQIPAVLTKVIREKIR